MDPTPAERIAAQLGREARERFVLQMCRAMEGVTGAIQGCLTTLMGKPGSSVELQLRREAWTQFQLEGNKWCDATIKAWQRYLAKPAAAQTLAPSARIKLELQDQDVVESQIIVSRFVEAVMDGAAQEFNLLRMRMKELEGIVDLSARDLLRPEVLVGMMLEQWNEAGMPDGSWALVQGAAHTTFQEALINACRACNEFLASRGILPKGFKQVRTISRPVVGLSSGAEYIARPTGPGDARDGGGYGVSIGAGGAYGGVTQGMGAHHGRVAPGWVTGSNLAEVVNVDPGGPALELAMVRAQGVIGQLKSLLQHRVAGFGTSGVGHRSAGLARALETRRPATAVDAASPEGAWVPTEIQALQPTAPPPTDVREVAGDLREDTSELKKQADSDSEKAVIEVVALMFQSILTEDRIPSAIRIWVARLQMPVLRVALSDPDFFDNLDHPARLLIDRIGSCVLGFDVATINGSELETEVKRVVQVIEQYPDTGRQVFQKVYDEFLQFLSRMLTGQGVAQRVVSVVQQVEQKETLAIRYTIEMRNMLKDIPVREEIQQFLFKVWADVLAVAAIKYGPQEEQTLAYKRAATDLVWSASAKSSRSARTRVVQNLPALLHRLREGMTALGLSTSAQEAHIKVISDTLADAFMSKTEVISYAQIEAMTRQLARLDDVVPPDGMGDLPLDAESIEMMLGIEASSLIVVADGGTQPSPEMAAWAKTLTEGTWFKLDHNGVVSKVQFAWRSDRQKLHLFAAAEGKNYLIQAGRLAAYLQAGLLVPLEEESLTVRATRDALAKIEANPERLVS